MDPAIFYSSVFSACLAAGFIAEKFLGPAGRSGNPETYAPILDVLPGTDCEKCGYSRCSEFASAVSRDPRLARLCVRAHSRIIPVVAGIPGKPTASAEEFAVARIHCAASRSQCSEKFKYFGVKSCAGVSILWNGNRECNYGCLGCGDCGAVCPAGAIEFVDDFLPRINEMACVGCGRCVSVCPMSVIRLSSRKLRTYVKCNTRDAGMTVHKMCRSGCIGCQVCMKACPYRAIRMEAGFPEFLDDRCTNCGICAVKCPTGVIECNRINASVVQINYEKCNVCGICAEICPAAAITGNPREGFRVQEEKCIGCGICIEHCPKVAINSKIPE